MMQISTVPLLFALVFWVIVFMLRAIHLERSVMSRFELDRRSRQGDVDAAAMLSRDAALPRLETLVRLLAAVGMVAAIALSIAACGWLLGIVLAGLLSIAAGAIARSRLVVRLVSRLFMSYESAIISRIAEWRWLDWFDEIVPSAPNVRADSKDELGYIIEQSAGVLSRDELRRLQAAMSLEDHAVKDVMTPVSVMETADINDALGPLVLDGLHKTGHSRFPVVNGDIHHIEGILYLHDIINLKSAKQTVREAMDPRVHYIHQEQSLEHALHGFLRTHRHLFIVVNDYRETVGVLTLEDVLETLLGKKIVDEFDQFDDLRRVAASNPRKNNLPKGKTDI